MNKYNEIMSNVTVDPEMKSRIMSAVSKAIKDQDGGAAVTDLTDIRSEDIPETDNEPDDSGEPVRKKARRIPVALITSIAAGLIVVIGAVLFIGAYLTKAKAAGTQVKEHNSEVAMVNDQIDSVIGANGGDVYEATTTVADLNGAAAETEAETPEDKAPGKNPALNIDNKNYAVSSGTYNLNPNSTTRLPGDKEDVDYSQGIGNERIDKISRKIPFDLESTGSGKYADGSTKEVFFGEGGEKLIIVTASEEADVLKKVFPSNKSVAVAVTTPGGLAAELYYVPFGNVPKLGKNETTDKVNAAVFKKNGFKYLIVFSDTVTPDVLYGLIDVL